MNSILNPCFKTPFNSNVYGNELYKNEIKGKSRLR